jgi:hypothetical protein
MDYLKGTYMLAIDGGIKMMPPPERIMTTAEQASPLCVSSEWKSAPPSARISRSVLEKSLANTSH